jgi:hypothetical protein
MATKKSKPPGKTKKTVPRTAMHSGAKLTALQVRAVRKWYEKQQAGKAVEPKSELARRYEVSPLVITRICLGQSYKRVV